MKKIFVATYEPGTIQLFKVLADYGYEVRVIKAFKADYSKNVLKETSGANLLVLDRCRLGGLSRRLDKSSKSKIVLGCELCKNIDFEYTETTAILSRAFELLGDEKMAEFFKKRAERGKGKIQI